MGELFGVMLVSYGNIHSALSSFLSVVRKPEKEVERIMRGARNILSLWALSTSHTILTSLTCMKSDINIREALSRLHGSLLFPK